jgi:hypothetical protein
MHSSIEALESRIAPASIALGTGTTNAGNTTLDMVDTLSATLNDIAGSGKLVVTGTVTINGATLDLDVSQKPADSTDFTLIDNDDVDLVTGTFAGLPEGAIFKADGTYFQISYIGNDGNDVTLKALVPKVTITGGGKIARFVDVDGDLVTVKTNRGTFTEEDFALVPTGGLDGEAQLTGLTLDSGFANATISITAKRDLNGGNGFVNVGFIHADGVNLGVIGLKGDLGGISSGDGTGVGLKSLTVQSFGRLGTSTQEAGGTLGLTVLGRVTTLTVKSDVVDADFSASGFTTFRVQGSFRSGSIASGTDIVTLSITNDLVGTEADPVEISAFGHPIAPPRGVDLAIKTLSVGGNVEWANIVLGESAAGDNADASISTVKVRGDWIASNLRVGTLVGMDGLPGTGDDKPGDRPGLTARDNAKIVAQIGNLIISGQVIGTFDDPNDQFGIVTSWLRRATIGGERLPLDSQPLSGDFFPIAPTFPGAGGRVSDLAIVEVLP